MATQILEINNKYYPYGTRICLGRECPFGIIHKCAIALAHTHPMKDASGHIISPKPSTGVYRKGKLVGDIPTAIRTKLPNIPNLNAFLYY